MTFSITTAAADGLDLICFCHLRWDFVYQRPQHLMSRFAKNGRVFIIEEPVAGEGEPRLDISPRGENVFVCVPRMEADVLGSSSDIIAGLVEQLVDEYDVENFIAWFYT